MLKFKEDVPFNIMKIDLYHFLLSVDMDMILLGTYVYLIFCDETLR